MARTCIIDGRTGLCTQVIEASGDLSDLLQDQFLAISDPSGNIGDAWDGSRWLTPSEVAVMRSRSAISAQFGNVKSILSPDDAADVIASSVDRASLLLNGTMQAYRTGVAASALADLDFAADFHFVLSNTGTVTMDRGATTSGPYNEYGILGVGYAANQRAAVCNLISNEVISKRCGRTVTLSGTITNEAGPYPFDFVVALVSADAMDGGAFRELVLNWTSSDYTAGNFFRNGVTVLGIDRVSAGDGNRYEFAVSAVLPETYVSSNQVVAVLVTETPVSSAVVSKINWRLDDGAAPSRLLASPAGGFRERVFVFETDFYFGATYDQLGPFAYIDAIVQAGGGAGRGISAASSQVAIGAGGVGGGCVFKRLYPNEIGPTILGEVGAGGAGGSGNGGDGGNSTLTSMSVELCQAVGGSGGTNSMAAGTSVSYVNGNSVGGGGTGGDVLIKGGGCRAPGMRLSGTTGFSVAGGDAHLGFGGRAAADGTSGFSGNGYGSGGSGGCANSATNRIGGDGAPGLIILRPVYL